MHRDSSWVFAAGLTPGVGAGLGAGYPHLGQWCWAMVILCAASIHLQMPVVSGGGGGSSWKKMCEWILLLQNDWAEVQVTTYMW